MASLMLITRLRWSHLPVPASSASKSLSRSRATHGSHHQLLPPLGPTPASHCPCSVFLPLEHLGYARNFEYQGLYLGVDGSLWPADLKSIAPPLLTMSKTAGTMGILSSSAVRDVVSIAFRLFQMPSFSGAFPRCRLSQDIMTRTTLPKR